MIVRSYIGTSLIHMIPTLRNVIFISTTRKFTGQNTYLIDAYIVTKYHPL